MKKAELTLETAKAMYKEGGVAKQFALDNYTEEELTKKELPKSWEELAGRDGYYVDTNSEACYINICDRDERNVFPTKKEAEACLALSQLCMLRDAYNGEPLEDWCDISNFRQTKYVITNHKGNLNQECCRYFNGIMSFKTPELRDEFMENFKDLLEIAKPLL